MEGEGAKNLAIMIAAILKEEQKTKGKARLTNLLKSGKELNVFSIQSKDLKRFSQEAKHYGVLYTIVKSKYNKNGADLIDVIARAEDAPKINRIVENFKLATIDTSKMVQEVEKEVPLAKISALLGHSSVNTTFELYKAIGYDGELQGQIEEIKNRIAVLANEIVTIVRYRETKRFCRNRL